ncbi:MAG: hypothetical protein CL678_10645 [Bdellovibrionaceae bacterium]|nr:hypothetical protein [Pseudobdellovibrionaceae bacterium]|tara:strand:- start:3148 stop:3756 length:609 start_codon:yes stop_codon:yes gene_type:complete
MDVSQSEYFKVVYKKMKKSNEIISHSGGFPNVSSDLEEWPVCDSCDEEMSFIFQILSKDLPLPAPIEAMQLFCCLDSDCETYKPNSGSSKVHLSKVQLQKELMKPEDIDSLEQQSISLKKEKFETEGLSSDEKYEKYFCDKFYGEFVGANSPKKVECSHCSKELTFLSQFSEMDMDEFEEWFISIIQICPDGHEAVFQAVRG